MTIRDANEQRCSVCNEPIRPGQSVVGTVERMIHLDCWITTKDGTERTEPGRST